MPDTAEWLPLWQSAARARAEGRVSQALQLYAATIAADPPSSQPFVEAGALAAELSSNLAGVDELYAEHCEHMRLGDDDCPARALHRRFVEENQVSAVLHLLRGVDISPDAAGAHRALAEALERMGNLDLALVHCRHAARLEPESHDHAVAVGRLLEAQGRLDRAVIHYRALAARWPGDPEIRARLIRAGGRDDSEPAMGSPDGASLQGSSADRGADSQGTDYLAILARTAAAFPPQDYPDGWRRELVTAATRMAEEFPDDGAAHLAKGYALLGIGELAQARDCFATASLFGEPSGPATSLSGRVQSALADARCWLLDPTTWPQQTGPVAPIEESSLKLAHARALRHAGDMRGALRLCDAAVANYFVRHTPLSYERYKQYKIVAHVGRYYAIPDHVREFKIIDGVVCRQSSIEQYARFRIARRVVDMIRSFMGHRGAMLRPLLRSLRRLRLWLYAVPGVKVASSMDALLADIDRSSDRTAVEPLAREG